MSEAGTEPKKLCGMGSLGQNAWMANGRSVQNLGWLVPPTFEAHRLDNCSQSDCLQDRLSANTERNRLYWRFPEN